MFNVTRRVSFSVAISITVGWGIFFLLFLASSKTVMDAQQQTIDQTGVLPPGVKLSVQVDKKIYRSGDTILIAVRNDSRLPVWLPEFTEECTDAWWTVEHLESDGESWQPVRTVTTDCTTTAIARFPNHSLKAAEWKAVEPVSSALSQPKPISTGTYRISVRYMKGKGITADTPWTSAESTMVSAPAFTIVQP